MSSHVSSNARRWRHVRSSASGGSEPLRARGGLGWASVRSLSDLLASAQGRHFLETRGVLTDPDAFRRRLEPPRDPALALLLGLPADLPLLYFAHQTLADFPASVVARFRTARDFAARGVPAALLWLDTDRVP